MQLLTNSLLFTVGAAVGSQIALRVACVRQPRPMPHQFAHLLEHPWRMKYRHPVDTLGLFGFAPGMCVLDLGCGTGLFTLEMARMVGVSGLVHAVDLQQQCVTETENRVMAAGLQERVRCHCSGAYQLPLANESIDLAILIATLPQIPNKPLVLAELARVLKPGGRLAVSEELPDPAYAPPAVVKGWIEDAGFRFGGQTGTFFCYSMIFYRE